MLSAVTPHDSCLHTDLPPLLRRNPGVIVMVNRPLHICYINVQAKSIINKLHHLECGTCRKGLPNAVMAFCLHLLEMLDHRYDTDKLVEVNHAIGFAGGWVILRGLGMPRPSKVDEDRLYILMEEKEFVRQRATVV